MVVVVVAAVVALRIAARLAKKFAVLPALSVNGLMLISVMMGYFFCVFVHTYLDCWPASAIATATALYRPPPDGCAIAPATAGTCWHARERCCCVPRPRLCRSIGWLWMHPRPTPSHCPSRTSRRCVRCRCPRTRSAVR